MFPQRLKELRNRAGLSQAQLAESIKVSQSAVGMWESGRREPPIATIDRLASLFLVSTDYLLGRHGIDEYTQTKTPTEPAGVRSHLIDKIMNDFMTLSEEDMHQVLDFVEFLISKRSS